MDFATAFAATGLLIDGAKKALEVSKKMKSAELQSIIADLMSHAADLKCQLADLKTENAKLIEEIAAIKKQQDIRSKLEKRDNYYYLKEQVDGYAEGPYCTRCNDVDNKLVIMHMNYSLNCFFCPQCEPLCPR